MIAEGLEYYLVVNDGNVALTASLHDAINKFYASGDAASWIQHFQWKSFNRRTCPDSASDRLAEATEPRTFSFHLSNFR